MGLVESIRIAGWRGGRLERHPVEVSAVALRRRIKGARRREAANRRVNDWRNWLRTRRRLTATDVITLLDVDQPVGDLFAYVDIEVDSNERIRQVGIVVDVSDEQFRIEATPADAPALSKLLSRFTVVAHNGTDHDFPRLEAAGVSLPALRIDTLMWSWLAWPTLESHALGALLEHTGTPTSRLRTLHDAVEDAAALADLMPRLRRTLADIDDATRAALDEALGRTQPAHIARLMIGETPRNVTPMRSAPWTTDAGAAPAPSAVVSKLAARDIPEGAVHVVTSVRQALESTPRAGLLARPSRVLDADTVRSLNTGWAKAVAVRVLQACRGSIELAPPSARHLIEGYGRRGSEPLFSAGSPVVTDLATATITRPRRHLVVEVPVAALFEPVDTTVSFNAPTRHGIPEPIQPLDELSDAQHAAYRRAIESTAPAELAHVVAVSRLPGVVVSTEDSQLRWLIDALDIGRHPHGATLVLDGPVGGGRSAALWRTLLGPEVRIDGSTSTKAKWESLDGALPAGRRNLGRRTAQLLSVAAARESTGNTTLVVDTGAHSRAVQEAAPAAWRSVLSTPLLRPPGWPTVDEARRRLMSAAAFTALVSPAAARTLAGSADLMLVARHPTPPRSHPTLTRMLADELADPFGSVFEPLSAHLAAQLVGASKGCTTVIADPITGTGVLAELIGQPSRRHLAELPAHTQLRTALFTALDRAASVSSVDEAAARAAARRLLPKGGSLKPFQTAVIDDLIRGVDVLAVFRTGHGKSLCYQVPALAFGHSDALTIVVSPLLALQRDQVLSLRKRGVIEAVAYNSDLPPEVRAAIRRGITAGFYSIVFVAPEALAGIGLRRAFADREVALIAVDEAHCISEMGHDFRPDYRSLPLAIRRVAGLPDDFSLASSTSRPQIVALTGTASPRVIDDIKGLLS